MAQELWLLTHLRHDVYNTTMSIVMLHLINEGDLLINRVRDTDVV